MTRPIISIKCFIYSVEREIPEDKDRPIVHSSYRVGHNGSFVATAGQSNTAASS